MRIDKEKCIGCGRCQDVCALRGVILRTRDPETGKVYYTIDEDECVDCGVCQRASDCPESALFMPEYEYPRTIRSEFSNPMIRHPKTNVAGRGTEEMKTNELTGKVKPGHVGIMLEMGRPNTGTRFTDVQIMTTGLADMDVKFDDANPIYFLFDDPEKKTFPKEILDQKVMSAIIEMECTEEYAPKVLRRVRELAAKVNTCLSVGLVNCIDENFGYPGIEICKAADWVPYENGKFNAGLGRKNPELVGKEN